MSDEPLVLTASDYEQKFFAEAFAGAEIVTVEVRMLRETYDDILAVAKQEGWEPEESLRILLTRGLGFTKGELYLRSGDERQDHLVKLLLHLESAAAVMKYYAFDFMRDNKVLEMRNAALNSMCHDLEATISRLRAENEALKAEIERRPVLNDQPPGEQAASAAGKTRSSRAFFRRRRER